MESHLSCQIQLCAPLASKRRDIFPFSSLKQAFFLSFNPSFLFPAPSPHVYTNLSSILLLYTTHLLFPFFCFSSPWVWLKVILHTLAYFQRGERERWNSRGGRGAARRAGCPQDCAVITFCFRHDWGSLEGHMGLRDCPRMLKASALSHAPPQDRG